MLATFVKRTRITHDVTTFSFQPNQKLDFTAGQYVEIKLAIANEDDRGNKRWFTLSSSPTEPLISITTKRTLGLESAFKHALFNLSPGMTVHISEPMGDFVLPKDTTIPLVFVVGGIGATPVRSIIKWLIDTGEFRQLRILYSAHDQKDFAFCDLFKLYDAKLDLIASTGINNFRNQLTAEYIINTNKPTERTLLYISGPEAMVEQTEAQLKLLGLPASQLVLDFFHGY